MDVERTRDSSFFDTLTLQEIYNKPNPRCGQTIPISKEVRDRLSSYHHSSAFFRRRFFETHGITSISSYGSDQLTVGDDPEMTWWCPHQKERQILTNFAYSLGTKGRPPVVLDVACGPGFLGKVLAQEDIKVFGVDIDQGALERLPKTEKDTQLICADIWDMIEIFGPHYDTDVTKERRRLFNILKERSDTNPVYLTGLKATDQEGMLSEESKIVQSMSPQFLSPSPIDMVVCSFMAMNQELTIPIRDGIHPKTIVYVRPTNGRSGAGDYYLDDYEDINYTYEVLSFAPGANYTIFTRWKTHSKMQGEWSPNLTAEVIIQVRNDVVLQEHPVIEVPRYPFDKDIETALKGSFSSYELDEQLLKRANLLSPPKNK